MSLRLEEGGVGGGGGAASRLVHLVEHQLPWDLGLRAVQFAGSPLKGGDVLLDDLVEEHGGELGVQQGAKLEGDLEGDDETQRLTQKQHKKTAIQDGCCRVVQG